MGKFKMLWGILLTTVVLASGILVYLKNFISADKYEFAVTDEVLNNPMVGFAAVADYEKLAVTTSLVYLPILWSELEPEEGKYNFDYIDEEYNLEKWRSMGKQVVLRFICDKPGDEEHMDIPEWLYEKTGDGNFYDCSYGRGYSPDYSNEVFIEYHRKAIEALGKQYGQDSFVCYIELGSIGHWGEWHVNYSAGIKPLPAEEICALYIQPYISAFPNAKLMMRRPYSYVSDNNFGIYNDMTGHREDTEEWLSWISDGGKQSYEGSSSISYTACPDIWDKAPVGGVFTSSISMDEMLGSKLSETIELLKNTHMSFIGPKIPNLDEWERYPEAVNEVLKNVGYRYGVSEASYINDSKAGKVYLTMTINNYGVAPIYYDWPLCVYLYDGMGNIIRRLVTDVNVSMVAGGEKVKTKLLIDYKSLGLSNMPQVAVGIEDPSTGKPAIELDMKTESIEKRYFITD